MLSGYRMGMMAFGVVLALLTLYVRAESADRKEKWEKTVQEARKEGRINIYISGYEKVVPAFQKAYPEIKVRTVTGRGSQLGPRIMAERRAGKHLTDVYSGGSTTPYMVLYRSKSLTSIKPALILSEVLDQSNWWQGKHRYLDREGKFLFAYTGNVRAAGVHYNTKLVDPKRFKSYWDLLKPKWVGKIAGRDMRQPGPGSGSMRFLYYNPEIGPEFVRGLFSKAKITLSRSYRQPTDWVATGRYPICLFCGGISDAKAQGLPVDSLPPHVMKEGSPVSVTFGTLALMKNAPHPNAAKVFINWLLSREGQIALQQAINSPTDQLESLREDIPKDDVNPDFRRKKGAKYIITDRPEWMNLKPVYKFINQALAEAGKR